MLELPTLNLTLLSVPRYLTDYFDKISIINGRIEFYGKKIVGEYDFSIVENFGVATNKKANPNDDGLYLIPNIKEEEGEFARVATNVKGRRSINIKSVLKQNGLLYDQHVDYEIIKKHPWPDGSKKDIIRLSTTRGENKVNKEEDVINAPPAPTAPTKAVPSKAHAGEHEYDRQWTWNKKIKFILNQQKRPLTSAEVIKEISSKEPKMDKRKFEKSISSILSQGVKNGLFKRNANAGAVWQYSLIN